MGETTGTDMSATAAINYLVMQHVPEKKAAELVGEASADGTAYWKNFVITCDDRTGLWTVRTK